MTREKALNINVFDESYKDDLALILDGVIENIQTSAVSEAIKNLQGSGTPEGGVIEYKRFVNAELKSKGNARINGTTAVEATPVFVNLDDDKEIVEELQVKDINLYGVAGMVEKRASNHARRIIAYLDRKFFDKAVSGGTAFTRGSLTDNVKIIDKMIVDAKSVESGYIDGIDAEDLALVLSPSFRKDLKTHMDDLPQGTVASNGLIGRYDGVDVFETHRLPTGINAIIMLKGSVAQPFFVSEYNAEKIPLDDAYVVQSFLYRGAEVLTPEAVIYDGIAGSL